MGRWFQLYDGTWGGVFRFDENTLPFHRKGDEVAIMTRGGRLDFATVEKVEWKGTRAFRRGDEAECAVLRVKAVRRIANRSKEKRNV